MQRILSILILFILVLNISFSSTDLLLENTNTTIIMHPKANSKLMYFLIYPSGNLFKEYILPFISSENLIKMFFHFQTLIPHLEFDKFLPLYSFSSNNVLTLKETQFLYCFENKYSSLKPILYSQKNEIPIIVENISAEIFPNSVLTYFSNIDTIVSLNVHTLSCGQKLLAAEDEDHEFFVALKKQDNTFETIAHGKILEIDFSHCLEIIWEAYNLKGCKKYFLKIIYFLQIFCLKYPKYILSVKNFYEVSDKFLQRKLSEDSSGLRVGLVCICCFFLTWIMFFCIPQILALPFYVLSIPFILYIQKWSSISYVPLYILGSYLCFFPQSITIFCSFDTSGGFFIFLKKSKYIWPRLMAITETFKIQPMEKNMFAIPSLILKTFPLKKLCKPLLMSIPLVLVEYALCYLPVGLVIGESDYIK